MSVQPLSEQITQRCRASIEQAQVLFNLPLIPQLSIECNLKGQSAGKIEFRMHRPSHKPQIRLRFNLQAAELDPEDMLNNTIPHEVAHLVVKLCPHQFNQAPHGKDWQSICKVLGGDAKTYHKLKLVPARQQKRWHYLDDQGQPHQLSTIRHKRLQKGIIYKVKASGAAIQASGFIARGAL